MAENHRSFDEAAPVVFQPDTLLPSQFFAVLRGKGQVQGEKRLISAVLVDAFECYMKQYGAADPKAAQLFNEAEDWIFGDYPGWSFSFSSICEVLGLEPEYLRRGLLAWRRSFDARAQAARASRGSLAVDAMRLEGDREEAVG